MADLHDLLTRDSNEERTRDEQVQHVAEALAVLYEAIGPEPEWMVEAACRGQTATMFPERGQDVRPAKALCAACPVLTECRAWADQGVEPFGIVAGMSPRQRRGLGVNRDQFIAARSEPLVGALRRSSAEPGSHVAPGPDLSVDPEVGTWRHVTGRQSTVRPSP